VVDRAERGAEADEEGAAAVVFGVAPERCDFPCRCAGTVLVTLSPVVRPVFRRVVVRVTRGPLTGSGPSTGRRFWWSELMHLTSVGRHRTRTPGERSGTHVNTP
jgi:hypothetical protein